MVNLSHWLNSVFAVSHPCRRKVNSPRGISPYVEILENRALLSSGSLVALELADVPGDQFDEVSYQFELTAGQASFTEFGVFTFDADGTVGGIAPGEDGFEAAVLASQSREGLIEGGAVTGSLADRSFTGGTRLGVYFCQETVTTSSGEHVSLTSQSENTFRVGWDEVSPIFAQYGPPSPRWFDDAVVMITVGDSVRTESLSLNPIADQAVKQEDDLFLSVTVNDTSRDPNLLRFQLDNAPTGAAIDAQTGLFTFPSSNTRPPGTYDVTVRVFDSTDPSFFATESFSVVVVDVASLDSARLTLYVDSSPVSLDQNIGIQSDGTLANAVTVDTSGQILFDSANNVTLGDFFNIWRTNAGLAGNNPDAEFNGNQLFNNVSDATSTVQLFVNGQINRDFENYIVQPDDEIVIVYGSNPVVSMNTNFGPVVIELFPEQTPITVNNFLNYINGTTANGGSYDGTFFHRSVSNFVIQAGGFSTPTETFTDTSQFSTIVTDPAITNEPGISNLRGTIAMAKLGGDPNSATSQFFVNLNDNSFLDDPANNEFTVFGQVLDLTTADRIASLPINTDNASPYGELPLSSDNKLAVVQSFTGQGNLTGTKFQDTNQNGVQDSGEAGIAGVTIYIDANNNGMFDAGEISTLTDANGQFLLQATPGSYIVRAEVSSGATQTVPTSPDSYAVDVVIGRVVDNLLFGEF